MSDTGWFDRLVERTRSDPLYSEERIYGRDGQPISFATWAALHRDPEYHRLGGDIFQTSKGEEVFVSTVWLGLDHNFGGPGSPIIFETLVFGPEEFPLTDEMYRYATEEEALAGHKDMVERVKSLLSLEG